jgi:hypothetical protein
MVPLKSPLVKVLTVVPLPGTFVPLTDIKVYGAAIAALARDDQIAVRIKHKRVTLKPFAAAVNDGRVAAVIVVMSVSPRLKRWKNGVEIRHSPGCHSTPG